MGVGALGASGSQAAQLFSSDQVFSREAIGELAMRLHDAWIRGEELSEEESEFDANEEYGDLLMGAPVAVVLQGQLGGSGKHLIISLYIFQLNSYSRFKFE